MRRLAVLAALLVGIAGATIAIEGSGSRTLVADRSHHFIPVAVSFVSSQVGFELGYRGCHACSVLRVTHDGGTTWRSLPSQRSPVPLDTAGRRSVTDVVFATRNDGWLFDEGMWDTDNRGHAFGLEEPTYVVSVGVGRGYAYAITIDAENRSKLWRTPVGNELWRRVPVPAAAHGYVQLAVAGGSLMLVRLGDGIETGQPGEIWLSRNRGASWAQRTVPCRGGYEGAATQIGAVKGSPHTWLLDCFSNRQSSQLQSTFHRLYLTRNDGATWRELAVPARTGGPAVLGGTRGGHFFLGVEGAFDGFYGSFDGGRHWHLLLNHMGFTGWGDLQFVNTKTGFVAGPNHAYSGDRVFRTDDAGRHWKVISAG